MTRVVPTVSLQGLLSRQGRRDPYPFYAELHRNGPVCLLDGKRDRFDLVVHGFDAVNRVLRDPVFRIMDADYPDRRPSPSAGPASSSALPWQQHLALRTLTASIFCTDGPDHHRVRKLFSQEFTARRVAALEPAVVRMTGELLDRLAVLGAGGRPVDFMAEFALPLPSNVIGELLGVPEADRPWFPPLVRSFGAILELGAGVWRFLQGADTAAEELGAYFTGLVARRRAEPRDDLISALVQTQAGGAELAATLTDAELIANLITMFNAGFVTTTHLIGNGLTLLLDRPALLATLLAEPERTPAYVEEILRYEPPVHFGIRWASEGTELAGVPVPADSRVLVLLGAANRDPERFADPDVFDPTRDGGPHLAFGGGLHYCLGAALSRLEGQLALPMLLRRFPNLALAGSPGVRDQLMLRGYDRLPVTVT
jgi:cytochrome P450